MIKLNISERSLPQRLCYEEDELKQKDDRGTHKYRNCDMSVNSVSRDFSSRTVGRVEQLGQDQCADHHPDHPKTLLSSLDASTKPILFRISRKTETNSYTIRSQEIFQRVIEEVLRSIAVERVVLPAHHEGKLQAPNQKATSAAFVAKRMSSLEK